MQSPMLKVVRKNGLEFNVVENQRIDFWRKLESNVWEPQTFRIFDCFVSHDTTYIDIGTWIGPTLLYAAQRARASYGFEPDPVAYSELSLNLQSNASAPWAQRVRTYQQAVDHQPGTIRIGSRSGGGDSMTSVIFSNESVSWEVEKISLADFFTEHDLRKGKVFIKMDIEGGEYQLLPHLRELLSKNDLVLYLSVHPWFLKQSLDRGNGLRIGNLIAKIRSRLLLAYHQNRLLRSLPFQYLYHEDGRPITIGRQSLRSILSGDFISTMVATHTHWEADRETDVAHDAKPRTGLTGTDPTTVERRCD